MYGEDDLIKILFADKHAAVIQDADAKTATVESVLDKAGVKYFPIGHPIQERTILLSHKDTEHLLGIDYLRDVWFE